jgi:hypothetical protein
VNKLPEIKQKLNQYSEYDNYIAMNCVFHDDNNPSLLVFNDGKFYCMGCSEFGGHERLYSIITGSTYVPARKQGTTIRRLDIPYVWDNEEFAMWAHKNLLDLPRLRYYWEDVRKFTPPQVHKFMLGHVDGWNVIPIRLLDWSIGGVVFRASPWRVEAGFSRYVIRPGQRPMMYVPDPGLLRRPEKIVVTFGLVDAMVFASLGIPAVTTSGNGQLTFKASWLDHFRCPVYVIPDKGERAIELVRGLGLRGREVRLDYPDGMKDPADFYSSGQTDCLLQLIEESQ